MVTRIASRTTAYFDIGQAKKENKVLNQYIRFHTIIVSMKIENNMTLVKFKFQIFNQITIFICDCTFYIVIKNNFPNSSSQTLPLKNLAKQNTKDIAMENVFHDDGIFSNTCL